MIVETYTGGEFYAETALQPNAYGTKWQNSSVKHQKSVDLARSMDVAARIDRCPGGIFHLHSPSHAQTFLNTSVILSALASTDYE
jgi:hypothetical protein